MFHKKISEVDLFTKERYQQFVNYFRLQDKYVLDFGCNTGRGGEILKSLLPNIFLIGADIIADRLLKLKDTIYDVKINLLHEKIEDKIKQLDVIVYGEVVEHIELSMLIDYFVTFKNLLNPNGLLILTTPNSNSFLVRLGRDGVLKGPSHINVMDAPFLKNLLLKIGFKNVRIKGSGKMTRYIGDHFPLSFYGSYLVVASI
jgi:2-polyprenyl-3-methyl-5-hydroxy-6-metoxy-1,4-benzoquinol methylase